VASEPMIKIGSDECNMVLVSKVFLARIPGKRVPLRKTVVQKRQKMITRYWEYFHRRESVPM